MPGAARPRRLRGIATAMSSISLGARLSAALDAVSARRVGADGRQRLAYDMPARPSGLLVWLHLSHDPGSARTEEAGAEAVRLVTGIAADRGDLSVLVTRFGDARTTPAAAAPKSGTADRSSAWTDLPPGATPGVQVAAMPLPVDTPEVGRRFLDHWRPDAILCAGPAVYPALLDLALNRGIGAGAVDVAEVSVRRQTPRAPLRRFDFVLPQDAEAARALGRAGIAAMPSGRIRIAPPPPACDLTECDRLRACLASRPVWLADGVTSKTLEAILSAQTAASHLSHRLLAIVVPARGTPSGDLHAAMKRAGWPVAQRELGEDPGEAHQVLLADGDEEAGLWYRLSPITVLAATLETSVDGPSPLAPAALGSAILCGPFGGVHAAMLGRLEAAGAALRVAEPADLGAAVEGLLAPDRVAEMANAGWQSTTEGAEATDAVRARLEALLDAVDR